MTESQSLDAPQFSDKKIIGIMVVTEFVTVAEERFAGILRTRDAGLQELAVTELVAESVLVFVAEVAVSVAFAFVKRYLCRRHEFVLSVFQGFLK